MGSLELTLLLQEPEAEKLIQVNLCCQSMLPVLLQTLDISAIQHIHSSTYINLRELIGIKIAGVLGSQLRQASKVPFLTHVLLLFVFLKLLIFTYNKSLKKGFSYRSGHGDHS